MKKAWFADAERRWFGFAVGMAALAGVIGVSASPEAAEEEDTYFFVEGAGAQDVDEDGFATIAEGSIDLDGDGEFSFFEADQLGMTQFIGWSITTPAGAMEGIINVPNRIKHWIKIGNPNSNWRETPICKKQTDYICRKTSTGYAISSWHKDEDRQQ